MYVNSSQSKVNVNEKKKHQKQLFPNNFLKSCSKKFCKFHRETPVLESPFNKVAGLHIDMNFNQNSKKGFCFCFLVYEKKLES